MNVPVTVNGITVEIPVDDKVIQEALRKKEKQTGYKRASKEDDVVYFEGGFQNPMSVKMEEIPNYKERVFENAFYYTDESVAKNNIRADRLMRKLRRFAAEHDGAVAPFENYGFVIFWNGIACTVDCRHDTVSVAGTIRFKTIAAAQLAILEFKDELEWYFTEYDPMPKGWWDN